MEISVTTLPKGGQSAFFDSHKQNEELYLIIKGSGQMQLDNELINVKEGSMVKVPPQCRRGVSSEPESQLIYAFKQKLIVLSNILRLTVSGMRI